MLKKEITKLINTKNALNTVKDDLISTVDRLMMENETLQDENKCLYDNGRKLYKQLFSKLVGGADNYLLTYLEQDRYINK